LGGFRSPAIFCGLQPGRGRLCWQLEAGNIDEQCFDLLCEPALNRQAF
jgi:hypothetical protein